MRTRTLALAGAAVLAASLGVAAPAYAASSPAAHGGGGKHKAPNCVPATASNTQTVTLSGPPINGVTPTGTETDTFVTSNTSPYVECLTYSVSNVNLPNGTVLTIGIIGAPYSVTITLENGAGTSAPIDHGHTSLAQEASEVFEGGFLTGTEILSGPTI
jgi:hypothetical protein